MLESKSDATGIRTRAVPVSSGMLYRWAITPCDALSDKCESYYNSFEVIVCQIREIRDERIEGDTGVAVSMCKWGTSELQSEIDHQSESSWHDDI